MVTVMRAYIVANMALLAGFLLAVGAYEAAEYRKPPPPPLPQELLIPVPSAPPDVAWFTVAEYRERIREQLEQRGYVDVCIDHLGSVRRPAPEQTVLWAQLNAINDECNDVSSGRRPLP